MVEFIDVRDYGAAELIIVDRPNAVATRWSSVCG
jgi:hypothetical protein